ncbi:MAG: DUF5989 family protein [Bdellovibrionales bacterium]
MSKMTVVSDIWFFLKMRKKLWLMPILLLLVLLGMILTFSQSSVYAPFIYTLF